MKENDIWWQGVVWDQFPDRLRVYLPGARPLCSGVPEWCQRCCALGSQMVAGRLATAGHGWQLALIMAARCCLETGNVFPRHRLTVCGARSLCKAGRYHSSQLCLPCSPRARLVHMLEFITCPRLAYRRGGPVSQDRERRVQGPAEHGLRLGAVAAARAAVQGCPQAPPEADRGAGVLPTHRYLTPASLGS